MASKSEAVGGCLGLILLGVALNLFTAWWGMLLIGILHHEVSEKIPAFGYFQVFWIVLALSFVGTIIRGVSSSGSEK